MPSPVRPWHKQTADGAWWVIADGILRPQMFGAKADGVFDCASPINDALKCADFRGGGTVLVPAGGTHLIKSGINLTGLSSVSLVGEPGWGSRIKCSADLNGANNDTKNDAIYALNFTGSAGPDGYPQKRIAVVGLVIDCVLMSAAGIDVDTNDDGIPDWQPGQPVAYGRSLAGIEIMNVDYATVKGNIIIGAYGNGAVIATSDPLLINASGYPNGVRNPIIEDNFFIDCVRGPLPQYGSSDFPDGISGSVLQIGSAHGGRIHKNYCIRPGGPFSDTFNCQGTEISDNYIEGGSITPIGASTLPGAARHQNVGTIRSDFGLLDVDITDNIFIDTGGIDLHGQMTNTGFFNGYTRTPGPQRCNISGNKILRPQGRLQVPASAMPASGGTITHNFSHRQPIKVFFTGGTGLTLTYRRGVGASFVSKTLSPEGSLVLYYGDALTISYSAAPTWVWFLAPNIDLPGIRILGGSVSGFVGLASANTIRDNKIITPGSHGIDGYDAVNNFIKDNYIENPGAFPGSSGIMLQPQVAQSGGGSYNNKIRENIIFDNRSAFLDSNIKILDATYSVNNEIERNTLALATTWMSIASSTNFVGKQFGPGALGGWAGGGQYSPPASGVEASPPGPGDWFATVSGGTVSAIATGKTGALQSMAVASGTYPVAHGEVIKITYSSAPALYWKHAH
ncbi:Pectate lyase superfamily protein [compost metagenome]